MEPRSDRYGSRARRRRVSCDISMAVGDVDGSGVFVIAGSVGLALAARVCSAWTVAATEVATVDSFEAAPQALRTRAKMERNASKLYLWGTVIRFPFEQRTL